MDLLSVFCGIYCMNILSAMEQVIDDLSCWSALDLAKLASVTVSRDVSFLLEESKYLRQRLPNHGVLYKMRFRTPLDLINNM